MMPEFELRYGYNEDDGSMYVSLWCTTGLPPLMLLTDLLLRMAQSSPFFSVTEDGTHLTIKATNAQCTYEFVEHQGWRLCSLWRAVSG